MDVLPGASEDALIREVIMKYAKRILVLMLIVIPSIASAQLQRSQKVVADVPFTFMVANKVVPLGDFRMQWADDSGKVLLIQNRLAKIDVRLTADVSEAKTAAGETSLVFHKYGRRYFLAGVKFGDSSTVYSFTPGRYEAEILASNVHPQEEVLVASLR